MFDVSTVKKRYFEIRLDVTDEDGQKHTVQLEVEPPKVKMLKKLLATGKDGSVDDFAAATLEMLNKNKSGYDVPMEYIDALSADQLAEILTAYFEWVAQEKKEKN